MEFTIANALTIIDKYKAESAKKMGMTFNNLCNSCTNVEAIPKVDYEARLKADMVAVLEDLRQDLIAEAYGIEMDCSDYVVNVADIDKVIQQKINSLKENKDGSNTK